MKFIKASLLNLFLIATVIAICNILFRVFEGINQVFLIMITLIIGTICSYFIFRRYYKNSIAILLTALLSPISPMIFLILFIIIVDLYDRHDRILLDLYNGLGFGGGYNTFSVDTYPPGSKWENNNWNYLIDIGEQSRKAIWEDKSLCHLNIFVKDASNGILFHEYHTVKANHIERQIKWDDFNNPEIRIMNIPIEFVGDKAIYVDTTEIIRMNLKYNEKKKIFEKIKEIRNDKVVIK